MPTLTIRNVDESIKARLRIRAAEHGQSMEEEVRCILRRELLSSPESGLGTRLRDRFKDMRADLQIPERSAPRTPIDFGASE